MVVEILRNHLGDENLDLSLGVLYEFIEVNDTSNTWEESSAFRRWAHDHSLRKVRLTHSLARLASWVYGLADGLNSQTDFCNAHVPRLGNIVVGNIQPTERLRQWREQQRQQHLITQRTSDDAAMPSRSMDLARLTVGKTVGIRNRRSWLINHTVYVSSPASGTNVLYSPTEEEFAKLASDENYGKGKLVEERVVLSGREELLGSRVSSHESTSTVTDGIASIDSSALKGLSSIKKGYQAIICPLRNLHIRNRSRGGSISGWLFPQSRYDIGFDLEKDNAAEMKSEPPSSAGTESRSQVTLETFPLPDNARVNGVFSRKFGLVENELRTTFETVAMDCAEEKVLRDAATRKQNLRDKYGKDIPLRSLTKDEFGSIGPFTADMFKDGGLDYRWKPKPWNES